MIKFNKLQNACIHAKGRRHAVARTLAVAVALVLLAGYVAVRQFAAPTYAGPITVTVKPLSLSPNPVLVGAHATASLSAYYTPPSGVPEGQLTATYDWSVSLQFKYTWLDSTTGKVASYGPPPANSYTDSISPPQPSASSGAELTFTPKIAGYWQVSASCGVTVTDSQTNQYWSGSATAGPDDLTSYELAISVGTPVVTGGSNLNVSVGEKIPLTAQFGPSDMTLQWNVPGSIIAGYTTVNSGPTTSDINYDEPSTAAILPVTAADLAAPSLAYYWMDTDSNSTENEKVTLAGTLPSGQSPPSASTTFSVYRPSPSYTTSYPGPIGLDGGALYDGFNEAGIQFNFSIPTSPFGGTTDLNTAQIVVLATETTKQYNSVTKTTTNFGYSVPSAQLPAPILDTVFPYGLLSYAYNSGGLLAYVYTSDSPRQPVDPPITGSGFGPGNWSTVNVAVSEAFEHDLLFMPAVPGGSVIWAPLSQVNWGWTAQADNGDLGFSLASSAKVPSTPPNSVDLSTLPVWNSNIGEAVPGGAMDPNWSPVP